MIDKTTHRRLTVLWYEVLRFDIWVVISTPTICSAFSASSALRALHSKPPTLPLVYTKCNLFFNLSCFSIYLKFYQSYSKNIYIYIKIKLFVIINVKFKINKFYIKNHSMWKKINKILALALLLIEKRNTKFWNELIYTSY